MESLEGYSYYDTPRGPQYIRNPSNENSAEDRKRGPTKYHPYAQSRRYDRLTNSPTISTEKDVLSGTDRIDYSSIYGPYSAETISPHALTSCTQMIDNNLYQDPSIDSHRAIEQHLLPYGAEWPKSLEDQQTHYYLDRLQNSLHSPRQGGYRQAEHALNDQAQVLLDRTLGGLQVDTSIGQPLLSEHLTRPISHGTENVQETQWNLSTGSNYDHSGALLDLRASHSQSFVDLHHWANSAEQELLIQHPEGRLTPAEQMRAAHFSVNKSTSNQSQDIVETHSPGGVSVKSLTPDMLKRRASTALTTASFQLPTNHSNTAPAESYIDQTLFEYAPFYDFPTPHPPQQMPSGPLDLLSSNLTSLDSQPVSRLSDDQDRPVPMVGLVGGYFPPEDDMSMYTSPQVNSQGNIRISRLPVKKVSVVYDVPEVSDMTVSQLKSELKKRNLPAIGKKSELQARLRPYMNIQV